MINRQLRKALLACGAVVVLGSAIPLVLATRRIAAEQAAYHAPASGRCVPSLLNATNEEMDGAAQTVAAGLKHPLFDRARQARRCQADREERCRPQPPRPHL